MAQTKTDFSKMSYDVTGSLIDSSKVNEANKNFPTGNLVDPGNRPFDLEGKSAVDIIAQKMRDWDNMMEEQDAAAAKTNPISTGTVATPPPVQTDPLTGQPLEQTQETLVPFDDSTTFTENVDTGSSGGDTSYNDMF